jgi:hypothetical protein
MILVVENRNYDANLVMQYWPDRNMHLYELEECYVLTS